MSDEDLGKRRTNLGRGLDALFGEAEEAFGPVDRQRASRLVAIEFLTPNPRQPRRRFDEEELQGLVASIREQGILQPILVRPVGGAKDRFEIVAGERRWRAAQLAQLHEIPVVIRDLSDLESLQIALIENIQRQDLTPLEEAEGYQRLIRDFGHTQEDLARAVGKSRSHIANTLRLLTLPEAVRALLETGQLTAGHARALLACEDPVAAAQEAVLRGLNVRQTEALARETTGSARTRRTGGTTPDKSRPDKDPDILTLEREMSSLLGLRVTITGGNGQGGTLTVHYQTLDQLDDVLHRLSQGHRTTALAGE